jgi:hypothetical protein
LVSRPAQLAAASCAGRETREYSGRPCNGGAEQAAEKVFGNVILSEAKNLALKRINYLRDPSSPSTPQDDTLGAFFRSL